MIGAGIGVATTDGVLRGGIAGWGTGVAVPTGFAAGVGFNPGNASDGLETGTDGTGVGVGSAGDNAWARAVPAPPRHTSSARLDTRKTTTAHRQNRVTATSLPLFIRQTLDPPSRD